MRKYFYSCIFILTIIIVIFSCAKKDNKVVMEPNDTPASTSTVELLASNDYKKILEDNGLKIKGELSSMKINAAGFDLYEQKKYKDAVMVFKQAAEMDEKNAVPWYNLACTLSLLYGSGEVVDLSELFTSLKNAVDNNPEYLNKSKTDTDLDAVRNMPDFKAIIIDQQNNNEKNGMVLLKGGELLVKKNYNDPGESVSISDFWIGKYVVTVGEFRRFVEDTGYKTAQEKGYNNPGYTRDSEMSKPSKNWRNPGFTQTDDHPVVMINWYDAVAYCNWLSIKAGLTPIYSLYNETDIIKWQERIKDGDLSIPISSNMKVTGYRLLTANEWEFAARGGIKSAGYTYPGSNNISEIAWHGDVSIDEPMGGGELIMSGNSKGGTHPVGRKAPNELVLYDMIGNVMIWTNDIDEMNSGTDLRGVTFSFKIICGIGTYELYTYTDTPRVWDRSNNHQTGRNTSLGFRVARNAE